jgi:hypothetical protein
MSEEKLLTPTEAAEVLGCHVGFLQRNRKTKGRYLIPFIKFGEKTIRYRMKDLLGYEPIMDKEQSMNRR